MTYELVNVDLPFLAGSAFLLAAMLWSGHVALGGAGRCLGGLISAPC